MPRSSALDDVSRNRTRAAHSRRTDLVLVSVCEKPSTASFPDDVLPLRKVRPARQCRSYPLQTQAGETCCPRCVSAGGRRGMRLRPRRPARDRFWADFRPPFPPAVAHRLLLISLTAAIALTCGIKSTRRKERDADCALDAPTPHPRVRRCLRRDRLGRSLEAARGVSVENEVTTPARQAQRPAGARRSPDRRKRRSNQHTEMQTHRVSTPFPGIRPPNPNTRSVVRI